MNTLTFRWLVHAVTFLASPSFGQTGWQWQNPRPQGNKLLGVDAIDANNAIAVGQSGTIIVTNDGGQNWVPQRSGTDADLWSVSFSDLQNGTAVGEQGTVLRTSDGGHTWDLQASGVTGTLRSVKFTDPDNGTVVEDLGRILRTTDGGSTWAQVTPASSLFSVCFVDSTTGMAVGSSGKILRTTDGDTQWLPQISGTLQNLFAVFLIDRNHAIAVGSGGTIVRTADGGATWTALNAGTFLPLCGVVFGDSLRGMAVGLPGTNYHTTDGGDTWFSRPSGTNNILWQADFADADNGITVGDHGLIMRTQDGGSNWTIQSSGTTASLLGVSFADANAGMVVGDLGAILHTTNGGLVWTGQTSGTGATLWSVSMTDASTGNVVGNNGIILRTVNGGMNWVPQSSGTGVQLLGVSLAGTLTGTAVGVNGTILRTTDGGDTWFSQSSGVSTTLNGVCMVDAVTAVAVGSNGTILRMNDGSTWTAQFGGVGVNLYGVSFTDDLTGTVVGANGAILRTVNGGASWTLQASGVSTTLNAVSFTSSMTGTATGFGGTIVRTTDGGANWGVQSSGTSNSLLAVDFQDENIGTATGFGGTVLRTTTGGLPPAPAFSAGTQLIDFGSVLIGTNRKDSVTVTNTGTATLAVNSVVSTGSRFTVTPAAAAIPPSTSRKFYVTFTPVSTGTREAEIIFTSNDAGSPDSIRAVGSGTTEGFGKFLTLPPDTVARKDAAGKFLKPVKRKERGLYPNWANLISEVVVQGGFQPWATESDGAGGMVVGISHMYEETPNRWKVLRDSARVRCWVRLSRWSFTKDYGSSYTYIQKTLEDNTGKHTGPARGFDATGIPGDPNRRPLVKQQTRLYPRKHSNRLFAELVALKLNIAASQLGKTPVGFGDLVFDRDGNICDDLAVTQISDKADSMLAYWQGIPQAQFDSLYQALVLINRAFLGPLDTLSFEADQDLIVSGAIDLGNIPFLKPGAGPPTRLTPTTHLTETGDDEDFGAEEFDDSPGVPSIARLYQNYPNPFNPSTTIGFRLRETSTVSIALFDMLGQHVATVLSGEELDEGYQTVELHAQGLASGVYFYSLRATTIEGGESMTETRKLVLLK